MALYIDTAIEKEPTQPNQLAQEANRQASAWADARRSREALERKTRRELAHPMQQKLGQIPSRSMLLYLALTVAYGLMLFWEWSVSREIYEVLIPTTAPWVPFASCVLIALYASACLAECTSQFSLFSLEDSEAATARRDQETRRVVGELYDLPRERKKTTNWFLNPITGVFVTLIFLAGVYYASLKRVQLLQEAGELPDADFQIYLPVVLYGVEILLGMPAFFCAMWAHNLLSMRKQRSELTKARVQESTVLQGAVDNWTDYMGEREIYNQYARRQGKPDAEAIPPSKDLRAALEAYFGSEPISEDRGTNGRADRPAASTRENGGSPGGNGASGPEGNGKDSREEELLNLLDEQIANQNRGL